MVALNRAAIFFSMRTQCKIGKFFRFDFNIMMWYNIFNSDRFV